MRSRRLYLPIFMSALIALMCSSAFAQQTGDTVCNLQTPNLMRCHTDFVLSGVTLAPNVTNQLSLVGSPANGISCANGLEATPQTVPANQLTTVTLTACSNSASNRYTWHAPAKAQITSPTTTDVTLASGDTTEFKVSACLASDNTCDCLTGSTTTCTLLSKTVTGATAPVLPTGCTVMPATQTIGQGQQPQTITASCPTHPTNTGLTYTWYDNPQFTGTALGTGPTYVPSTTSSGSRTYYPKIVNAAQQLGAFTNNTGATVNVQASTSGISCQQAGITNFDNVNFMYKLKSRNNATIAGNGKWSLEVVIPAGATTINQTSFPRLQLTQLHTDGQSSRTISLSRNCGDFSPTTSVILQSDTTDPKGFLVTDDDVNRLVGINRGVVTAGQTWYLNVRNDNCTSSGFTTCNFAYSWSNPAGSGYY